jgi:hypothetical protein
MVFYFGALFSARGPFGCPIFPHPFGRRVTLRRGPPRPFPYRGEVIPCLRRPLSRSGRAPGPMKVNGRKIGKGSLDELDLPPQLLQPRMRPGLSEAQQFSTSQLRRRQPALHDSELILYESANGLAC